ncbi:antitoxin [Cryptosporangium phraense]|uniref:Antitoxin n=1 Tax=Cryptosporangium phraense TaxID=2593070 RepID=A0A545ALU4_9ACTN|nr:antitoxin [Cryptosporangium phraense]TQS42294.1 antitoxin [Cryptosporangium phraense]
MGFLDKAKDFIDKNDEKIDQGLDKAGDFIDEKTGHKHSANIDKAVDAAQKYTGDGDTTRK